jgi:hypothetical protein
MNGRQGAIVVGTILLFLPACVLVYHLASVVVGALAEPIVALTKPFVIIDHFHVEVYLEAVFLTACLVVRIRRVVVWTFGLLVIPTLPVWLAIWNIGAPRSSLPGRSLLQDATLWSLESIGAGLLACVVWEVACRAFRRASHGGRQRQTEADETSRRTRG